MLTSLVEDLRKPIFTQELLEGVRETIRKSPSPPPKENFLINDMLKVYFFNGSPMILKDFQIKVFL